jgi:hypothetical protein
MPPRLENETRRHVGSVLSPCGRIVRDGRVVWPDNFAWPLARMACSEKPTAERPEQAERIPPGQTASGRVGSRLSTGSLSRRHLIPF